MTDKYFGPLLKTSAVAALLSFFIATDVLCIFIDARRIHLHGFEEDGFVEWWQQIQIFITVVVLVAVMWKNRTLQPAFVFMAGCLSAALIREFNNFFNGLFRGAWLPLVVVILLVTAFLLYQKRKTFLAACYHFTRTSSFGITLAGFFVTFIYSRILGTPPLWRSILETRYTRYAERMVEESTELVGYTIMAFGICRYAFSLSKQPGMSGFEPSSFTEKREPRTLADEE